MSNAGLSSVPITCCFEVLFLAFLRHEGSPSDKGKVADLIIRARKVVLLRGRTLLTCVSSRVVVLVVVVPFHKYEARNAHIDCHVHLEGCVST